ncbi:DUF262 domain-containing protein [Cyanobacterium aponinum]|uniref:GmrSD restriction endonucleases N-terminal domain-containing protein n=2 Tax=Cyanobacterium aponinum TaxID=379064 RepID=K9Z8N4_CYAAP|nr:DUF262 domain-containing protein [Cyanobacterium aponinum]AFZ54955.1 protein of unknown function DUF262 [Cyanobacterium aponinum PCC 10605]MTF39900.1 DUF262 domain-containing protein [Cyanobacterium aponinum 0216]
MNVTLKDKKSNYDNYVIETDEDTPEEYDADNSSLYPYDPLKTDIDIRENPYTVFELKRRCDKGQIILDPEFQRNPNIWTQEQKSKFIESIILNFPLPYWYVKQTQDGKYIIVDGLQRTSAIRDFIDNNFKLTGLKTLSVLNDNYFDNLKQLKGDYETRIEDKKISLYVIPYSASSKVVYDIFERVNTGGTQLNRQEIRNCIFAGKATKLLKKLSEQEYFKQAIDYGFSPKRMKDRELILRYLAFKIFDDNEDYQGDMSDFIEEAMKKINLMSDDKIDELIKDFERVMKLTYDFFGKENFRLPNDKSRGKVNMIMFESISYFFSTHSDQFLQQHKEIIKQNFLKLRQNQEYVGFIKRVRNDKNIVIRRFDLAQQILGKV